MSVSPSNPSSTSCGFCPYVTGMDILSWKNPVTTGFFLAITDIAFLVFWGFNFSIISLASILALVALGLGFFTSMMGVRYEERIEFVTKEQLQDHMTALYDVINTVAREIRDLVYWKDQSNSLKAAAFLAVLAYISSWISFALLSFFGINILFFSHQIVEVYEKYAAPHVAQLQAVAQEYIGKIPKMSKQPHIKSH